MVPTQVSEPRARIEFAHDVVDQIWHLRSCVRVLYSAENGDTLHGEWFVGDVVSNKDLKVIWSVWKVTLEVYSGSSAYSLAVPEHVDVLPRNITSHGLNLDQVRPVCQGD